MIDTCTYQLPLTPHTSSLSHISLHQSFLLKPLQAAYRGRGVNKPEVFWYNFASSIMQTNSGMQIPTSFLDPLYIHYPDAVEAIVFNLQFSLNGRNYINDFVAITYNTYSFAVRFVELMVGIDVHGKLKWAKDASKRSAFHLSWDDSGLQPALPRDFRKWDWVVNYNIADDNSVGNVNVTGVGSWGANTALAWVKWDTLNVPLVYPGVPVGTVTQWFAMSAGTNTSDSQLWGPYTGTQQVSFVYGSDFKYRADLNIDAGMRHNSLRAHGEGMFFAVDQTGRPSRPVDFSKWDVTVDSFKAGFGHTWASAPAVQVTNWGGARVSLNTPQGTSVGTFGVQLFKPIALTSAINWNVAIPTANVALAAAVNISGGSSQLVNAIVNPVI